MVFTYYETQQGLEDLYFDSKGLLQDTKEGALLVDLSPTTPSFARELYAVARVNERNTLDAPLVVRNIVEEDAFASCDNLMIFVGGEEESYEEAKPMLHAIARHVLYLGEAGCGQSAKVMATLQRASALIGVIESYATYINGDVRFDWEEVIDTLSIAGSARTISRALTRSRSSWQNSLLRFLRQTIRTISFRKQKQDSASWNCSQWWVVRRIIRLLLRSSSMMKMRRSVSGSIGRARKVPMRSTITITIVIAGTIIPMKNSTKSIATSTPQMAILRQWAISLRISFRECF